MTMIDLGGTYRARSPEETLAKIEPMLWDSFGISRVANITGLDHIGIPTYIAIRPQAKLLSTAQGKGVDDNLAKISAMMESIEGWHCENMPEPDLFGSYHDLKQQYPLIELNSNINHGPFEWTNIEHLEIPWGRGIELNTNQKIYFPYTTLNVNTTFFRPGYRYFPPTTNGLASGNTEEEAICHALFEVLEREFEAEKMPIIHEQQVDLTTIKYPHLLELLDKIQKSKLSIDVWDLSTSMKIPTYLVVLNDPNDLRSVGMILGTGSHFSSVVALSRAITEAVQGRATIISGSRDDLTPRVYKTLKTNRPYLLSLFKKAKQSPIPFIETTVPDDFVTCKESILKKLNQNGFKQVIVYNHTREEFNIPVVHVIVPGLRYIHGSCFSCPVSIF